MALSKSAAKLRQLIERAIEDHKITHEEYDQIIHIAYEDGHIDAQEKAMIRELQKMIEDASSSLMLLTSPSQLDSQQVASVMRLLLSSVFSLG